MRIGLFGGSFDPVHYGHLILAELAREACALDEVRFIPAAIPPHKQDRNRASGEHRVEMLRLGIGGNDHLDVWDGELQRGGVSYTVETLRGLTAAQPNDDFYFLAWCRFHLRFAQLARASRDLPFGDNRGGKPSRFSPGRLQPFGWTRFRGTPSAVSRICRRHAAGRDQ